MTASRQINKLELFESLRGNHSISSFEHRKHVEEYLKSTLLFQQMDGGINNSRTAYIELLEESRQLCYN